MIIKGRNLAFKSYGIFLKYRCVDLFTSYGMEAGLFDLVCLLAGFDAKIIGDEDGIRRAEGHGEGAGLFKVFGGLVFREHESDFPCVALHAPGSVHGIRDTVFVVGAEDENSFWRNGALVALEFDGYTLFLLMFR